MADVESIREWESKGHDAMLEELQRAVIKGLDQEDYDYLHEPETHPHGEHNFRMLLISTLLLRAGFGAAVLLFPIYMFSSTSSPEAWQVGVAVASYFMGEMATITMFGAWSDRLKWRKPFIAGGALVAGISFLMFPVSTNWIWLTVAHALEGVGAAMLIGPSIGMITESVAEKDLGAKMGWFQAVNFGGMAVGMLVGALFWELFGWGKWTWIVFTAVLFGAAYVAWFHLKEDEEEHDTLKTSWGGLMELYRQTIDHRMMLAAGVVTVIISLILYSVGLVQDQGANDLYPATFGLVFAGLVMLTVGWVDLKLEKRHAEHGPTADMSHEDGHEEHGHVAEMIEALKHAELQAVIPAWLCVQIIIGAVTTFLPEMLGVSGGHGPAEHDTSHATATGEGLWNQLTGGITGFAFAFVAAMVLLGVAQVLFGKQVDRWGRKRMMMFGLVNLVIATFFATLLYRAVPNGGGDGGGIAWLWGTLAVLAGIGASSLMPASLTAFTEAAGSENKAMAGAIFSFTIGLGELIGDLLGGVWIDLLGGFDGNGDWAFLSFCVAFALLGFAAYQRVHFIGDDAGALLEAARELEVTIHHDDDESDREDDDSPAADDEDGDDGEDAAAEAAADDDGGGDDESDDDESRDSGADDDEGDDSAAADEDAEDGAEATADADSDVDDDETAEGEAEEETEAEDAEDEAWTESSLMALKKADLTTTAEGLGVEVDSKWTKQQIADAVLEHLS